jgi:hypothetical protein
MQHKSDLIRHIGSAVVLLSKTAASPISYSLAGRLILSSSGWLILSVPASLVRGAHDALHEHALELPDDFGIPVMTPSEVSKIGEDKISERGHSYRYTLGPVRSSEPNSNLVSKTWYVSVYSQELKKLRKSYNLDSYINNAEHFKLPIGIRKVQSREEKIAELYLQDISNDEYDLSSIKESSYIDEMYSQNQIPKLVPSVQKQLPTKKKPQYPPQLDPNTQSNIYNLLQSYFAQNPQLLKDS